MCWIVGYKKNITEYEIEYKTVFRNNYCTHNDCGTIPLRGMADNPAHEKSIASRKKVGDDN